MNNKQTRGQVPVTKAVVGAKAAGQHASLSSIVFHNPEAAAALTRLTAPKNPVKFDNKGQRQISKPNTNDLLAISSSIAQHAEDAESILYLFSDVKVACEILISSIRSPNDMYEGEVNFKLKDNLHVGIFADKLLPLVKTYFSDVYPLADKFEKFLRSALFGEGSAAVLVMPENSLSDIIYGTPGVSMESNGVVRTVERKRFALEAVQNYITSNSDKDGNIRFASSGAMGRSTGDKRKRVSSLERLGATSELSTEDKCIRAYEGGTHKITSDIVLFEDDPKAIQLNSLMRLAQVSQIARAQESLNDKSPENVFTDRELAQALYRNTTGRRQDFIKVKTDNEIRRYSVGRPFVFEPPPESIVPVNRKSSKDDPVGFIVLIDPDGGFLSRVSEVNQFKALRESVSAQQGMSGNGSAGGYGDMSSYLLNRTAAVFGTNCEEVTMRQVSTIFEQILEAEYSSRFRTGYLGGEVSVADLRRISDVMLHRVLANQQTKMLFVPASMMTYFAYDYRPNGTGKNLLEEGMSVFSMRGQLLFARVMGAVKNAIGRQTVSVEIDPDEPDPQRVFDMIKSEVVMARQMNTAPISTNTTDIVNQIQAMSVDFQVSGNEGMPNTKITYAENQSNYARPDDELSRELTDLMINHIGVPPEMIEEARRSDFATVAIANNILFSKRVRDMQRRFDPHLTKLTTSMLMADSTFIIEIKKVIEENFKDLDTKHEDFAQFQDNQTALVHFLAMEFISNLVAFLAQPDIKSLENNLEAMRKKEETVDASINWWLSEGAVNNGMVGEQAAQAIGAHREMIKAAIMRQWMIENNILPELSDMFTTSEDGKRNWDVISACVAHATNSAQLFITLQSQMGRVANATQLELNKLPAAPQPSDGGGGGFDSFGGDSGGSFDSGGDDGSGGGGDGSGDFPSEPNDDGSLSMPVG